MKNIKSLGVLFGKKMKEYEYKYDRNIDEDDNIKQIEKDWQIFVI